MRPTSIAVLSCAACCLALAAVRPVAHAQSPRVRWLATRIDPRTTALFAHRAMTGETFPSYRRSTRFERDGTIPLVVRFVRAPTVTEVATLGRDGVVIQHGGTPLFSGAYSVRTDERGVAALASDPNVTRVEVDLPLRSPRPLDLSVTETQIADARRALLARDGTALDGHGVVIGDVDTGLFFYHPALFRADAGSYAWVDVNHTGRLEPGVDGVDMDHNGEITPDEVLRLLPATLHDVYGGLLRGGSVGFHPDRDWLYLDVDGNGARDFGLPFHETDPAYGEPIFVLDDANHDAMPQPSEHLLRLGTCKVSAILGQIPFIRGNTGDDALINNDPGRDATAYDAVSHATGVAGILVGGIPGVSRLLGLAPGADLIVADDTVIGNSTGTAGALQWEMDQGANILLTEYAPYANVTLDGSSEEELLLDAALTHNVVPVSPAGNLARSKKHRHLDLVPGDNSILAQPDDQFASATLIQISLHDRDPSRVISVSVTLPSGQTLTPPRSAPSGANIGGGITAYTIDQVTSRGTHERHVMLYRRGGFASGDFTLHFDLDAGAPVSADLYVGDDVTSWGGGFQLATGDDSRTVCHPATSDHTLTVAAYVLHGGSEYGAWGAMGERAGYSSVGPRIDGETGIDIAAPDNPMSLSPVNEGMVPLGSYAPFGGTSGAGPHVAASVALLRQLYPSESAVQIRARVVDHARTDSFVRAGGATSWGAGKLDLLAASELSNAAGQPPRVTLDAISPVLVGTSLDVAPQVTDDGPPGELLARWDLDSDGHTDTDWIPVGPQRIATQTPGFVDVRIEVRDVQGNLAATSTRIEVARALPMNRDAGVDWRSLRADGGGCACRSTPSSRPTWPRAGLAIGAAAWVTARRRRQRASRV